MCCKLSTCGTCLYIHSMYIHVYIYIYIYTHMDVYWVYVCKASSLVSAKKSQRDLSQDVFMRCFEPSKVFTRSCRSLCRVAFTEVGLSEIIKFPRDPLRKSLRMRDHTGVCERNKLVVHKAWLRKVSRLVSGAAWRSSVPNPCEVVSVLGEFPRNSSLGIETLLWREPRPCDQAAETALNPKP